jgi:hypothetical protein
MTVAFFSNVSSLLSRESFWMNRPQFVNTAGATFFACGFYADNRFESAKNEALEGLFTSS